MNVELVWNYLEKDKDNSQLLLVLRKGLNMDKKNMLDVVKENLKRETKTEKIIMKKWKYNEFRYSFEKKFIT